MGARRRRSAILGGEDDRSLKLRGSEFGPMEIHHEALSDVERYMEKQTAEPIDRYADRTDEFLWHLTRFGRKLDGSSLIADVGPGIGWFPILATERGIRCRGIEISPQLVELGRKIAAGRGVDVDLQVGNLETTDLGENVYDGIIAANVLEHVEDWRAAVRNIYRALKPGAAFYFESVNRWYPRSPEYPPVPFYGWLPNPLRFAIRKAAQGADIMKLGIDFNQFTHPALRREFRRVGFSEIYDRVDLADVSKLSGLKGWVAAAGKKSRLMKAAALAASDATRFICVK